MPQKSRQRSTRHVANESFAAVVRGFMDSPKFKGYRPSTSDGWGRQLRLAARPDLLGALTVYEIRPSLVQAFLDGFADRPGKREVALKALKQLERWAIVRDLLPHPVTTGVEVEVSTDRHKPWTDAQVALGEKHARHGFSQIITLASNTGQRISDIVAMRWADIEPVQGRPGINVTQKKTGKVLWIPFTQPLMAAFATWDRGLGFIAVRPNGHLWTSKLLSTLWPDERANNPELRPLTGLVLHGLRATACVRLSRAGATTRQISDWIGMSEKQVARYCRFSLQKENALAAVLHLDRTHREQNPEGYTPVSPSK